MKVNLLQGNLTTSVDLQNDNTDQNENTIMLIKNETSCSETTDTEYNPTKDDLMKTFDIQIEGENDVFVKDEEKTLLMDGSTNLDIIMKDYNVKRKKRSKTKNNQKADSHSSKSSSKLHRTDVRVGDQYQVMLPPLMSRQEYSVTND
ncbi:hypothetical protein A3Q56_01707 [Intoshia linei]|uniref:Uncharacterized protein n=1 Tax=Intoshia linei TaxID=1819745 RepID=A0A177BA83_9BILA|nr:hypothetical protein A3Q56_01707 [Intoshia linei]